MCKKSFSAATYTTFFAATKYSKCGPLQSPWKSVNIPSPSPFLSLTTRTVPLHFFCSRRATRKACVGVESSVRLTSLPLIHGAAVVLYPWLSTRPVRLTQQSCLQRWRSARPSLPMPASHLQPRPPTPLPPPLPHPRSRSRRRRRKVSDGKTQWLWSRRDQDNGNHSVPIFFFYQSQRRQMSTCWAGFKGTAWGTRPSWLASMMSQMPEETRCARTPWWNLRCSMGHWGVPCMV